MRTARLAVFVLGVTAPMVSRAAVELSAVMELGGHTEFVLTDTDDGATSGWIELGRSFHGYRLVGYDPRHETLSVRKDGGQFDLRLKTAHVTPLTGALPPELVARGITPDDLIVRDSGPVRIFLAVGTSSSGTRFIDLKFDNGTDRCAVEFGEEGPQSITRALIPEAVRDAVAEDDLAAINAHLATVRGKWMPPTP